MIGPQVSRLDQLLHPLRWVLAGTCVLLMLVLAWWVLPPELGGAAGLVGVVGFVPMGVTDRVIYYLVAINYLAVMILLLRQLYPQGRHIAPRLAFTSPPQRPAILTAALMAGLLSTGLIITLLEMLDIWVSYVYSSEFTTPETHLFRAGPGTAVLLIAWAMWIAFFTRVWKQGNRYQQIHRILGWLSSMAMMLVIYAALVHSAGLKRDPQLIHQILGSYTGLMFGSTVLLWTAGAWVMGLFHLKGYEKALADRHSLADDLRKRYRVSWTFRFIYFTRRIVFVVLAIIMAVVLWAMVTDILVRVPIGSLALKHLEVWSGYWLLPDHGLRGIMGFYPATRKAHLFMSVTGTLMFLGSQLLFMRPWKSYLHHLTDTGRMWWPHALGMAMPTAALLTGAVAFTLETMDKWSVYIREAGSVSDRSFAGIIFQPTFWIALPVFIGSYILSALIIRFVPWPGTYFMQRTRLLYALFVIATIELFIAGMVQTVSYGYGGPFYDRGTFTAICLSGAVTMWTFLPSLRLIYASQDYAAIVHPMEDHPPAPDQGKTHADLPIADSTSAAEETDTEPSPVASLPQSLPVESPSPVTRSANTPEA